MPWIPRPFPPSVSPLRRGRKRWAACPPITLGCSTCRNPRPVPLSRCWPPSLGRRCWICAPLPGASPPRLPGCWPGRACSGPTRSSKAGPRCCSPTWSAWGWQTPWCPPAIPSGCAKASRASLTRCWWTPPAPERACSAGTLPPLPNGLRRAPPPAPSASGPF